MGVGLADVVLDHERLARVGRDGPESRVVEAQPLGAVKPLHERPHKGTIGLPQVVCAGAVDRLRRDPRLQGVELAVGVHHDHVQAVGAPATRGREQLDVLAAGEVALDLERRRDPVGSLPEGPHRGDLGGLERQQHPAHLLDCPPGERRGAADAVAAVDFEGTGRDHAVELTVLHAAGQALLAEGAGPGRSVGAGASALKQREQVLDAVVGDKRVGHESRQQHLLLAQGLDDPLLGHHTPLSATIHTLDTTLRPAGRHVIVENHATGWRSFTATDASLSATRRVRSRAGGGRADRQASPPRHERARKRRGPRQTRTEGVAAWSGRTSASLLDQAACEGVANELGAGGEPELLLDMRAMGLDGPDRKEELLADLGVRVPKGDQAQHFDFSL